MTSPPQATDGPQAASQPIPHVWVQPTLPGCPVVLAGQVMGSDGRPVKWKISSSHWSTYELAPVRLAPRTQEGLDQLFDQLLADAERALKGAA